jgi:ABC-2 type transport system ATP-binding protein
MADIAVKIDGVAKDFRLPHEKVDSVKSLFVNPFRAGGGTTEVQHALKDISIEIKKGEFFGIVGRNGSGKSTLLKIIAGIYQPTNGTVTVNGRLVPFIELGVGFNPELTGRENVYLNGALMGFSTNEVDKKYEDIVEFAELPRFMDQKLKNYSSGMQVRLAFSVATILAESDILLIDEVLAVGDADFQRKCFNYFKKLKKEKKTVIFVSHDMGAVREYCDRAVLIDKSEVILSGTSEKVAKEYIKLFLPDIYAEEKRNEIESLRKKDKGKWGMGGVDIRNVRMNAKVLTADEKFLEVSLDVKVEKDINEELVAGLIIKNQADQVLFGTNTAILEKEFKKSFKKGEVFTVDWKIPNIFNEGRYIFEPAINSPDDSILYQWWDEALVFEAVNEHKTPYLVAPEIDVTLKPKK